MFNYSFFCDFMEIYDIWMQNQHIEKKLFCTHEIQQIKVYLECIFKCLILKNIYIGRNYNVSQPLKITFIV